MENRIEREPWEVLYCDAEASAAHGHAASNPRIPGIMQPNIGMLQPVSEVVAIDTINGGSVGANEPVDDRI